MSALLEMATTPLLRTAHPHRLPSGWPLKLALVGFPLVWVAGLSSVIWPLVAVPMTGHLLLRRRVLAPAGFGLLVLFLAWVLLTGTQADTTGRVIGFTYRWGQLTAGVIALVYVLNLDPTVPNRRVMGWLSAFWMFVVFGGFLGLVAGPQSLPNPLLGLLPGSIRGDEFVRTLLQPPFAQIHTFLGYPLPRPAAPFAYTNTWGATYALLLPAVAATLLNNPSPRQRRWLPVALVLSVIPVLVSVNRGMWIGIGVWLVFTATQRTGPRVRRALFGVSIVLALGLVIGSLSPAAELVRDRLDTPHSNNARLDVAGATVDAIGDSPVLGYGAPRPYEGSGIRPPLGTQGLLWYMAFSHGIPALLLLVAFFVAVYRRLLPQHAPTMGVWARGALVVMAVLMPFYDFGGLPMTVVFVLLGVGLRESALERVSTTSAAEPV